MADHMSFRSKEFWPPQSPDLNPLDYSVWWHIESKACKTHHSNADALMASVDQQWKAMSKEHVTNVCKVFCDRLEAVIEANGAQIHS